MKLREYQQNVVDNIPNKWALWFRQRVGKTPTAIRLASTRVKSCLVIVPKHIKQQWENEIALWNNSDTKFFVITKETFRRDYKIIDKYEAIIIDEIHRHGSNYKNLFFKALMSYIKHHNVQSIWLLSGTPYTASPWAPYSYKLILGFPVKWFDWKNKYFYEIKMGRRNIPVAKKGIEMLLQQELKDIGTIIDLKDVAEVVDDYEIIESFTLNNQQKKAIKEITEFLPIVKYGKTHQLEQGVKKSDGYTDDLVIPCDKDNRVKELAEDEDKIIIVCRYLAQIEKYKKILADIGKPILAISGQEKEVASIVAQKAESHDKCVLLVQSDTCDGYSLKSFNTMVFASQSYSFVNLDQMKFRIKATDKTIPCTYIYLITKGDSLDRAVHECVARKEDFSEELYGKKKQRS